MPGGVVLPPSREKKPLWTGCGTGDRESVEKYSSVEKHSAHGVKVKRHGAEEIERDREYK